ncbi:MAG TPA: VIT1/CCC1 transporter family protein [Candidatus Bathyarchaeia archaeon]
MAVQSTELVVQETGSRSAELVFGSIDGLFSVLGIISAAGSAALIPVQIFATGVGGAVAGALSVFAATYLSETHEKKTQLLEAITRTNRQRSRQTNGNRKKPVPLTTEHPKIHRLLGKINRRALGSGIVTAITSALASLVLLLPLVLFPETYAVTASIIIGVILLFLLGAFRGVTLKQSAAKSAMKMVVLGILVILASKVLGSYVLKLVTQ